MLDDGDNHGEAFPADSPIPLSPNPPLSEPIVHAPLAPGPSNSNQDTKPPDFNSLHITSPPFSPESSGNASPITPVSPGHDQKSTKRPNPLIDLIDTEKTYVDLLSGIIRKVAGAWSKSNLPPKELDSVFRAIEGIYKANRSLLNRLKEIGPKPSSPKALGDLLMRWVDDLESPYSRYATVYLSAFDEWDLIRNNKKLPTILSDFTNLHPVNSSEAMSNSIWTLDALLALPRARLKYYKRLYGRLLKSTNSGRSDFQLLLIANEKLDQLMNQLETRAGMRAGGDSDQAQQVMVSENEIHQEARGTEPLQPPTEQPVAELTSSDPPISNTVTQDSPVPSHEEDTSPTPEPSLLPTLREIEDMVDTRSTLDIFSMKPKPVKLSLSPPGLPFTRQLRSYYDVIIKFTSRADGIERTHEKGRIFLMTDLFLVCEQLPNSDIAASRSSDSWPETSRSLSLCYPPLAARHLAASPAEDSRIDVVVLKKEVLHLYLQSSGARDSLLKDFESAIQTAHSLGPGMKAKTNLPSVGSIIPNQNQGGLDRQIVSSRPSTADTQNSIPFNGSLTAPHFPNSSLISPNGQPIPGRGFMSPPPSAPLFRGGPGYIAQPKPMPLPPDIPNMLDSRASTQMNGTLPPPTNSAHALGPPQVSQTPHRQYSAPPPEDYRPPPRGTSLAQADTSNMPHQRQGFNVTPVSERPYDPGRPLPGYQSGPLARDPSRSSAHSMGDHVHQAKLRKASSSRSLNSQYSHYPESSSMPIPPMPSREPSFMSQYSRSSNLTAPALPSVALRGSQAFPPRNFSIDQYSPPPSPTREAVNIPTTSTVSASMKCKVFLKQQHAQWKSLGAARLKLFHQHPTHVKQLVVEADTKDHPVIISTIILTDGVERVGKTGVAIELSDKGQRTGIVYMIQLRNETSAGGLFDQLLLGSDRQTMRP